ncbi:conserved hypothetical protein [Candida dubliniensis CD36]|uniref:Uncharacterized protein n=1 Tax=Candida dubliniensis (strain CD36 / ATCC MYA-646 / CBS 7987 / NCPF 3949 / NRRL Y-17841) TaxID=573826 RepID=B9WDP1_CANDC|nr:conserved hypothetical protein [Candida dubliniensis CD36]CAX42797.1 conserved hypothetical protein [Candida dubliniensis CD36]
MESPNANNSGSPPEYISQPPPKYVSRPSSSSSSVSDQESDIHNPPQKASNNQLSTCCSDCWCNCFNSCSGTNCTASDKNICGSILVVLCCGTSVGYATNG